MKTLQWLKNSKGVFEQVGSISPKVKWVYFEFLNEAGRWVTVTKREYPAAEAFQTVVTAIEKKQTGKWFGYRLVAVENTKPKKKKNRGEKHGQDAD